MTAANDQDFEGVRCPHCDSADLALVSLFGGSVSEVMFRCLACRTFFNWIKWRGKMPPHPSALPAGDEAENSRPMRGTTERT